MENLFLTAELLPLLEKGAETHGEARVVIHSSEARHMTPNKCLEEEYLKQNGGNLGGSELKLMSGPCFHRYFQSKLATAIFHYALHEKLQAKKSKVISIAAQPGGCSTNLGDHLDIGFFSNLALWFLNSVLVQTKEDGAMGILLGMASPNVEAGILYGPKGMAGLPVPNECKPYETEEEVQKMLWSLSEEAVGCKFVV